MSDVEQRIGIEPLDGLLAKRDTLVRSASELRAKHDSFGTWNDLRKIQLSTIATAIRAKNLADGVKMTEVAVDDLAHSDSRYVDFIAVGTQEKCEWAVTEAAIQAIEFTIRRGDAIARYASQELGLAR